MTPYCQNILKQELTKHDYDGKTSEQSWAWLTQPTVGTATVLRRLLTPGTVAGLLGPAKAEVMAVAIKSAFPTIADHLLTEGVDVTNPATVAFLTSLVGSSAITQQDANRVIAAGTTVTVTTTPPMFDQRFSPVVWPHVDDNGNATNNENDRAIHQFPNTISRSEFDAAWTAAGRT